MLNPGKSLPRAILTGLITIGSAALAPLPAMAGKVMWKENPNDPGCSALAFADTGQWFATAKGDAFKKGVCHGKQITFDVELAEDGDSFTVLGQNFCTFHVGKAHIISATCHPGKSR